MTNRLIAAALLIAAPAAMIAAGNPSMLVSGTWLADHLKDRPMVILHVGGKQDYDAGHIPGAQLVTLGDLSITDATGLRLELPPAEKLEEALGKLGIGTSGRIIVYAGNDSVQSATRVWFTLDYVGLGDRAALLDGGLATWKADGRAVSKDAVTVEPQKFKAKPSPQLVVTADWVRAHLNDSSVQVLDARLPEFYSGANAGGMPRAGHIPGARSVPYSSALSDGGKLKSADTLREMLAAAKSQAGTTVTYCHIGQQATVLYFVARYLGLEARLYDGSFQDWSRRNDLPVESAH
jgi:thiosulfate/3-mercaptopyruvate sulfurtransferase